MRSARRTPPSGDAYERTARDTVRSKAHLLALSTLLELNSGLEFSLAESAFDGVSAEQYLDVLQARVRELSPEMDAAMLERLVVQYQLQVDAQLNYELQRYDGQVFLAEPISRDAGLPALQLRAFAKDIETHTLPVGEPSARTRTLTARFGALGTHYRCMRDDEFVRALAQRLDSRLR